MPIHEYPPNELLAPYVQSYCVSERPFQPDTTFDIFPDATIELVWNLGVPCSLVLPGQTYLLPSCYVVGLLQQPLQITADGLVQVIRARLYPWALYPFIGAFLQPAAINAISGLLWVSPELIPPQPQSPLPPSNGGYQAVGLLQDILLAHVLRRTFQGTEVASAAQTLVAQHGNLSMQMLAQQLGRPERSLRRQFHSTIHASPKEFARLVRFEFVRNSLWQNPDAPLAEIALEAGYSDQAHMQREFRSFSNTTPRQFASDMHDLRLLFIGSSGRNIQDS